MKKIYQLMMLVLLGVTFSSCDHFYSYYDDAPFLGTWEAYAYVEYDYPYDLRPGEWHKYVFYSDGTGYYTQADGLRTRILWDEYSGDRLKIRHDDGLVEYYYYGFQDRGRYLCLSEYSDFRSYFMYR